MNRIAFALAAGISVEHNVRVRSEEPLQRSWASDFDAASSSDPESSPVTEKIEPVDLQSVVPQLTRKFPVLGTTQRRASV